ncbi:unnamed protein product, partial [Owenia fusiformis]
MESYKLDDRRNITGSSNTINVDEKISQKRNWFVICVLILLALVFLALIILIVAIFLVLTALKDSGDNKIAPSNGPKEQCAYVPPNITNKAGLGRFKFFNAL